MARHANQTDSLPVDVNSIPAFLAAAFLVWCPFVAPSLSFAEGIDAAAEMWTPVVYGLAATELTNDSAGLEVYVNARTLDTVVRFHMGTSPGVYSHTFDSGIIVTGDLDTLVSVVIPNLSQGSTYYFIAEATNAAGSSFSSECEVQSTTGITFTNSQIPGSTSNEGSVKVIIVPGEAAITARWRLSDSVTVLRSSGTTLANRIPGKYLISFTGVSGYEAPSSYSVTLRANTLTTVTANYLRVQSITFPAIADRLLEQSPVTLSATASSGLPVTYTALSGPATRSGNLLTLTGYGTVSVRATQAGNGDYAAAPSVTRTFDVLGLTPATWTSQHFTPPEIGDAAISGPLADPDRDGICNLLEFAFNLDPKVNGRPYIVPDISSSGLPHVRRNINGNLVIEFIRRKANIAPGISTTAEFASDASGPWIVIPAASEISTTIDPTFERVKITDTDSGSKRYVRVRVSVP